MVLTKYLIPLIPHWKVLLVLLSHAACLCFCRCDCYIMKDILQNWSDEEAAVILANLYTVSEQGARLLVIETVLHTGSYSEERVSLRKRVLRT